MILFRKTSYAGIALLLVTVLMTSTGYLSEGLSQSDSTLVPPSPPIDLQTIDVELTAARERLTNLLASDSIDRVEFKALNMEVAIERIHLTVDTFLSSFESLGNIGHATTSALLVTKALDDHRIQYNTAAYRSGEAFRIESDYDARELGRLIYETSLIIHRLTDEGRRSSSIQDIATSIFEGIGYDSESGHSILYQYRARVRELSSEPVENLTGYLEVK